MPLVGGAFSTSSSLLLDSPSMAAAGYDQVAVQLVPGHEHAIEGWAKRLMG